MNESKHRRRRRRRRSFFNTRHNIPGTTEGTMYYRVLVEVGCRDDTMFTLVFDPVLYLLFLSKCRRPATVLLYSSSKVQPDRKAFVRTSETVESLHHTHATRRI